MNVRHVIAISLAISAIATFAGRTSGSGTPDDESTPGGAVECADGRLVETGDEAMCEGDVIGVVSPDSELGAIVELFGARFLSNVNCRDYSEPQPLADGVVEVTCTGSGGDVGSLIRAELESDVGAAIAGFLERPTYNENGDTFIFDAFDKRNIIYAPAFFFGDEIVEPEFWDEFDPEYADCVIEQGFGCFDTVIATPPDGAQADSPAESATGSYVMPDAVGMDLQAAQDLIQEITDYKIFFTSSEDASGAGRMQLVDSNWLVCAQNIPAGSIIGYDAEIIFFVVKFGETCP